MAARRNASFPQCVFERHFSRCASSRSFRCTRTIWFLSLILFSPFFEYVPKDRGLRGHPLKAEFGAPNSLLAKRERQQWRDGLAWVYNGFQPKANTVICLIKARHFYFGGAPLYFVSGGHLAKNKWRLPIDTRRCPHHTDKKAAKGEGFSERFFDFPAKEWSA